MNLKSLASMAVMSWRGITRRQLRTAFLLGCAYFVFDVVVGGAPRASHRLFFAYFIFDQIKTVAMLMAVVVADRATGTDPNRRGVYALAVLAGSAVGVVAAGVFGAIVFASMLQWGPPPEIGYALYRHLDVLLFGGAAGWLLIAARVPPANLATAGAAP